MQSFRLFRIIIFIALLPLSNNQVQGKKNHTRYQVAVCDWMVLKRQKLGEFSLAKQLGADGVELDMGPLGKRVMFDNKLRDPEQARQFKNMSDSLLVKVPSVALSGFFAQNFITRNNYLELVSDCFTTMKIFGSKVAFLPLGGSGNDWKKAGAEHDSIVCRLHGVGEMARKAGVVVGIRTAESAEFDIRLLKEVDSKGIKIYYNFQDAADQHRDICKELQLLGKKRIAQIHASNTDSVNLEHDPEINLRSVRNILDKIGWSGWLVIERSRDVSHIKDVKYNYGNNVKYIKKVFTQSN